MKQAIRFVCVCAVICAAICVIANSFVTSQAQSVAPLLPVDDFTAQITQTAQTASNIRTSFVGGLSGDGRFAVIESNGDIATERTAERNNLDNNREIFLFDYAQRRIFQITDTRSALLTPTPTPTPSPSATPVATPAPGAPETIETEVANIRPAISNDGRFIVFQSNVATPASFDGNVVANRTAIAADANQEIFLYQIPATAAADLASGAEAPFTNLAGGTFTRLTDTPASRLPRPGTATTSPVVADDNRFPAIDDVGTVIAFTSTRNITGGNTDGNPEIILYNRETNTFTQLTSTPISATPTGAFNPIFNENPSLSGDGATIAFVSNANIFDVGASTGNNADNNAEIYLARLNTPGGTAARIRQLTQTTALTANVSVNIFSPGRRLSRDGRFLAFESTANIGGDNAVQTATALFITDVSNPAAATFTFTQVGPRPTSGGDVLRFPTFVTETAGDGSTFNTLVFTSVLNFRSNGGVPDTADPGLNPVAVGSGARPQIFAAPVATLATTPAASLPLNTFVRLTNFTTVGDAPQAIVSNTRSRIAFSLAASELGGGNADGSAEVYYLLTQARPNADATPTPAPGAVSFFTGATSRRIAPATATPTPTPSPAPAEADVSGLAAGMLVSARTTDVAIGPAEGGEAPCQVNSECQSTTRSLPLPIQLRGVTVSIGGAAAGLKFVSANRIDFVVPVGLALGLYNVVINNNGTLIRSQIRIVAAQPDIVSSTNGAGGRASATNVTNPLLAMGTPEPFTVTTTYTGADGQPRTDPTRLRFILTGIRNATDAAVTVRIGTIVITGDANIDVTRSTTPGFDQLDVLLPATLAAAGDVPVIIEVNLGSVITASRPTETAPRITIN